MTRINPDLDPNLNLSQADMENNPIVASAIAKVKRIGSLDRCLVTVLDQHKKSVALQKREISICSF
ncbi:MAG: hypothetical protein AAFV28_05080 [Cyanobacteria bacterium J06635_13]